MVAERGGEKNACRLLKGLEKIFLGNWNWFRAGGIVIGLALACQAVWPEETGRIFVYAQREFGTRSWEPVWCDGTLVAKIKRGTFFVVNVGPGRHVLQQAQGVPVFVKVGAGAESFVRLGLQVEGGQPPVRVLNLVQQDVASNELRFLSYIDLREVLVACVSKNDPRLRRELRLKSRVANE